jgi:hypothetical protein
MPKVAELKILLIVGLLPGFLESSSTKNWMRKSGVLQEKAVKMFENAFHWNPKW